MMKWSFVATLLVAVTFSIALNAAEIMGTVRETSGDIATIVTDGDAVPAVGDKAEIFFKLAGDDAEISVGSGKVSGVASDSVQVKIDSASGKIEKDHLVRVSSSNPTKRVTSTAVSAPLPAASTHPAPGDWEPLSSSSPLPSPSGGKAFVRARELRRTGDADGAIAAYTEIIQMDPLATDAYLERGAAYTAKKKYDDAIADANAVLKLDAASAKAYYMRALSFTAKKKLKNGIADCDEALKIDPRFVDAYVMRASCRINSLKKSDLDAALADLNTAIEINPTLVEIYYTRGFAYANKGEHAKAIADWERTMGMSHAYGAELEPLIKRSRKMKRR